MQALILHNPDAGNGTHSREELEASVRMAGWSPRYLSTKGDGFKEQLAGASAALYVIAGGDGTVAKVLTGLEGPKTVAIVPLGTSNNVAHALGISGVPHELALHWELGHTAGLDVGVVRGPWGEERFVEAVGFGAIAETMNTYAPQEAAGADKIVRGRETLSAVLAKFEPRPLEVRIDGRSHDGDYLAVEVLNIGHSGPALRLAPDADPGDGLLDVLLVGAEHREGFMEWLREPDHAPAGFARVERGRNVSVTWRDLALRIDDEVIEPPDGPAEVVVEIDRQVRVLVRAE